MSAVEQKRSKAAIACSKKLMIAAESLRAYLAACEDCNDGSGSITRAGKGRDGRETMIADLVEYASYLDGKYSSAGGSA